MEVPENGETETNKPMQENCKEQCSPRIGIGLRKCCTKKSIHYKYFKT